ncbi:MAG: GyrI-like domain-containing protein [Spirochaetes bacterium]|nr:GyrI-like domain-containing protein [Spirochaetota bacterium]
MTKVDFRKELKALYAPSVKEVAVVEVPRMNFLKIDGEGDPNSAQTYQEALEALYTLSYTIKFKVKKGLLAIDYGVMPLEGLWWADDMTSFATGDKSAWKWTAMIAQPDFVSEALVHEAIEETGRKKVLPALAKLRFEPFDEGSCAQIMYIGPFSAEGPTIERVHAFISASGHQRFGKHHEIYLSDLRRTAPEKWKIVIRQPMK